MKERIKILATLRKVKVVDDPTEDRDRLCIFYYNFMEYFCYTTDFFPPPNLNKYV